MTIDTVSLVAYGQRINRGITMFNFFKKPAPIAAPMPNDMPLHAGFRVVQYMDRFSITKTYPTLKAAQIGVARMHEDSRKWIDGLAARGVVSSVNRRWTIQNLENGRFCEMRAA
jgi:hypothetical protein